MSKQLFVVAAGSGGHILPALTLTQQWKQVNPKGKITLFTGNKKIEQTILQDHAEIDTITSINLPQFSLRNWWKLPFLVLKTVFLFLKSLYLMFASKPEKVISTGGILSIPICLAAWLARTPIELYELNVIPGKANFLLLPFAKKIYSTFKETKQYCNWKFFDFASKCQVIEYPIRFTQTDKNINKQALLGVINKKLTSSNSPLLFDVSRKTIFVLGGSQGSQLLNNLITGFVEKHLDMHENIQIIHQTGKPNQSLDAWYVQNNVPSLTFTYDNNIHYYYLLADLVISRAGAGTLFELAFFNKKSIIIPLVAGTTDHQIYNGLAMAKQHPNLFTIIKQPDIVKNPELCFNEICNIL